MKPFRWFDLFLLCIGLLIVLGGCKVKGTVRPDGWVDFKGNQVCQLRKGNSPGIFYLNWGNEFGWAKYDSEGMELSIQSANFGYEEGSWNNYSGITWHVATPDFKSFLFYQGRGIDLYRKPNSNSPKLSVIDVDYNEGADWMLVNDDFTSAIVPLELAKDSDLDNFYGGVPLSLFKIDLVNASYTIQRMDHFAESYLGPGYVVWRHLIKNEERGQDYKTSHFSATGVDLVDKDLPLIRLLNRYKDSLPVFHNRFAISSQGWALLGVHSPKSDTEVFLLNPENGGQIIPVFVSGYALPIESMSRCAISDDGQYFAFVTRFKDSKFSSSGGEVVHLGRVHRSKEGLDIRITRIGEFSDLDLTRPIWISGTHALTLVTDPLEHPSLIRIYDLDKKPVDWAKVDLATKHDEVK